MANKQATPSLIEKSPSELAEAFAEEVKIVWENGFMGINIGNILIAVAIFLGFLLLRGLFSKYILTWVHNRAIKSATNTDDLLVDALIPPLRFVPVIMGLFAAGHYLNFSHDSTVYYSFTNLIRTLIAFTIFWALHRGIIPLSHKTSIIEKVLNKPMAEWIFRCLKFVIIFIGAAVVLDIWGIQVGPILAGLGLFGAAVALGAQDLFKNLIGGLTILAEKRFQPGDYVLVEGVIEGVVEEIGFRSTRMRRLDKVPAHVPNALLSDAAIMNFTRMSHRRIFWKVGLRYDTTTEQLRMISDKVLAHIKESKDFAKGHGLNTFVGIDSFSSSSIDIMIYCFTSTTVWEDFLKIKEELAFKLKTIVEDECGADFAYPTQTLLIESLPMPEQGQAEIFKPESVKKPEGPADHM